MKTFKDFFELSKRDILDHYTLIEVKQSAIDDIKELQNIYDECTCDGDICDYCITRFTIDYIKDKFDITDNLLE